MRRALTIGAMVIGMGLMGCSKPHAMEGLPDGASENAKRHARACDEGDAESCYAVGLLWSIGDPAAQGVPHDAERALALYEYACRKGVADACRAVTQPPPPRPEP